LNKAEFDVLLDTKDLNRFAILLDIDGTLLDIAPTPYEVVVPSELPKTLAKVGSRLDGALALVSGRRIEEIDSFFSPFRFPAIGGHGAEMRPIAKGGVVEGRASLLNDEFKQNLKTIAKRHPGVLIEDKGYSLALHYRQAPKQGVGLIHDIKHAWQAWGDRSIEMLTGKAVIELKFAGFNKGTAVRALMSYPPFAGRAPIFVGDDHTDEDAFKVVPEFNGHAISVGRRLPRVLECFDSPTAVRQWLQRLAQDVAIAS
jgi:trehalose 6-phosphate phosphatase